MNEGVALAEAEKQKPKATEAAKHTLEIASRKAKKPGPVQPVKITSAIPIPISYPRTAIAIPPELAKELKQLEKARVQAVKGNAQAKAEFEKLRRQYSHDLAKFLVMDADRHASEAGKELMNQLGSRRAIVVKFREEMRKNGIIDMYAPEKSYGYWLFKRLGDIADRIDVIREEINKIKGGKLPNQVLKRLEVLYAEYNQTVNVIYHPAKLLLVELKKGDILEAYLRDSEAADHSLNKVYSLRNLKKAGNHLVEALRIMQYASAWDMPKRMVDVRKEFAAAAEEKTTALARLYISENVVAENVRLAADRRYDPAKRFVFYRDALVATYDASVHGKGFDQSLVALSGALLQLETCMATSDKKLFASGEAGLQQSVIANSEKLIANYTALLSGRRATLSENDAMAASAAVKNDSDRLYARIRRVRRIDQLVELSASLVPFLGPAFMAASMIKGAAHDYATTNEISPMTGVMAAAALLGLRGGLAREAFAALERSAVLRASELGVVGALTVPQVRHVAEAWAAYSMTPEADKSGRIDALEEVIFSSISLSMPLAAGVVHAKAGKMVAARREIILTPEKTATRILVAESKRLDIKPPLRTVQMARVPLEAEMGRVVPAEAVELVAKTLTGDGNEFAKNVAVLTGQSVFAKKTLHETVLWNRELLRSAVESMRGNIETALPLFRSLDNAVKARESWFYRMFKRVNPLATGDYTRIVISLDKGRTWLLNALSNRGEYGDLGLIVFFRTVSKTVKDLDIEGVSLVRTGADDATVLISDLGFQRLKEKFGLKTEKDAANFVMRCIAHEANIAARQTGITSPALASALSDFSGIADILSRDSSKKVWTLASNGRKYKSIETAVGAIESRSIVKKVRDVDYNAAKHLEHVATAFDRNPAPKTKKVLEYVHEADGRAVNSSGAAVRIDEAITFRVAFGDDVRAALMHVSGIKEKGTTAVEKNIIGPSVTNTAAGSAFTNALSAHYASAFEKAAAEAKIFNRVVIYETGPMSFGFRFSNLADSGTMARVLGRTEELFLRSVPKELGITNIKTFRTKTVMEGRYRVADALFGEPAEAVTPQADRNAKVLISAIRLGAMGLREYLLKNGIGQQTINATIKAKNENWLRGIEDLRPALLKNGATSQGLDRLFELYALPHRIAGRTAGTEPVAHRVKEGLFLRADNAL